MNKPVIIFDFDGVIVDSLDLSFGINKAIMPDLEYEEWQSWFEGNLYKRIRKEHANEASQNAFFEKYNEGIVNILPINGMTDIIKKLTKKYTLIIISSSSQKGINSYLKKYGLNDYFTEVLGKETHKRKVDKFHMILEKYNIAPHETLIITDSVGDILEAKEVGVKTLAVLWGVHSNDKIEKSNPHFIASKPDEIIVGINTVLGK